MEISIELYLRDAKVGFLEAAEKYALVDQVQQEIEIIKNSELCCQS